MARKSFSIHSDYYAALCSLSAEQRSNMLLAFVEWASDGEAVAGVELDQTCALLFMLMKAQVDRISAANTANGAKGGQAKQANRSENSEAKQNKPTVSDPVTVPISKDTTPLPPPEGEGVDCGQKPRRKRKPSDSAKKPYGVERNVMLTDEEYEGLNTKLQWSVKADLIDELSLYLASKGDKYKNHSATLQAWDRKRKEQGAARVDNTKPIEAVNMGEMQSDGSFISDDGITRWYPPDGFYEAHPELRPQIDTG